MAERQLDRVHKQRILNRLLRSSKWRFPVLGVLTVVVIFAIWWHTGAGDSESRISDPLPESSREEPPHGGIGIPVGEWDYGLEMVLDPEVGGVRLYVMDRYFRRFVPIQEAQLELLAFGPRESHLLRLQGVGNRATWEEREDTAMFQGRASWLKGIEHFRGTIRKLRIRDRLYTDITFDYVRPDRRRDGRLPSRK